MYNVFGLQQEIGIIRRQFITCLNTNTPCAACKLLRRRCGQECPFFPYFPPHEPQKFASVHKVFGASNVSKMLMEVPEEERADAANSLVYEANLRLKDPVYGCMGVISALQQQLVSLQAELDAIRAQIILHHKVRESTNTMALPPPPSDVHIELDSVSVAAAAPPACSVVPLSDLSHPSSSSSSSFYFSHQSIAAGFRTIPSVISDNDSYFN